MIALSQGIPAVAELAAGRMVILSWAEGEAGGDLLIAAQFAGPEAINLMAKEARGLISLAITAEIADALALEPIPAAGNSALAGRAMVSIEAATGITTGISAADRARTIEAAAAPGASATDLVSPGHVFPLRAWPHGFDQQPGRVEAAVDLMAAAGLRPAAVLCQILDDEGELAGDDRLSRLAESHGIAVVSVEEALSTRPAADRRG